MSESSRQYKLLIIGDELNRASNTAQWLAKTFSSLEVEYAHSGKEGILKAETFVPDVFLVEVLLPDIKGLQIIRHLRGLAAFSESQIILMSNLQSDEQLIQEAIEAGADFFLQKPFEYNEMQQVFTQCLNIIEVQHKLKLLKEAANNLPWSLSKMQKGSVATTNQPHYIHQRAKRSLQLFENAPDAIAVTIPDGTMLDVNDMLCRYSGYSRHELIGRNLSMLFSGEHLQLFPFEVEKVLGGEVVENERFMLCKSGHEMPIWMKSMRLPDHTVVSFMRDITAIRQTEQELKQQKAFSQNITEKIPNIVYVHDLESRKNVYTNRSVAAYLGYPADVLTDNDDNFLEKVIHPDDLGIFDQFYAGANLSDPELIFHFEYRMRTYAGDWRWFKGYERVWEQKDGKITMLIGAVLDVTSEKEKDEALRKSEQKYRELMELFRKLADNMPDMLWAKDVHKRFIFVNNSICRNLLHAANTDEPLGKTDLYFAERIRAEKPEDPEYHTFGTICTDSDEVILQTRQHGHFEEFGYVRGKFLFLDVIKAPIFDENGELIAIVGAGRDITDRKRQEKFIAIQHAVSEAMTASNNLKGFIETIAQQLSQVIDTSNFYVALVNERTGKLYTPYLQDEKDDIHEWDMEGSATGLVIKSGKTYLFYADDIQKLINEGALKAIGALSASWLGVPLWCDGVVVGALVVQSYSNKDAFQQSDAELLEFLANQLGLYIQRIKALDEIKLLGLAIEQSPVGVIIIDNHARFVYANKQFSAISGYTSDMIPTIDKQLLFKMFGDEEVVDQFYQAAASQSSWNRQLHLCRPDGSKVWINLSMSPLFGFEGRLNNWMVIIEDTTEKQRMLDDLIKARDKAEESDRLKSAFLMNISHEIRTPLNSIMGFADLLTDQSMHSEHVTKQAGLIYRNGQRLLDLINNILKISKIDAGSESLSLDVFNPAQLVDEALTSFKPQADKRGITLKTAVAPEAESIRVETDRLKIHQVLDNLINNALKFTEKGTIEIGCSYQEGMLKFSVSDTGRGIPAAAIDKIFDRFYQAETALNRGYEGVGLGLALCRSMVTLMGGRIWAESVHGKGSVFQLEIPARKVNLIQQSDAPPSKMTDGEIAATSKQPILVADDDEASLIMMKTILSGVGYHTVFARSGIEAIELLKHHPEINLILLDIKMPVLDGRQTMQKIREMGINAVIIATTAYALPGDEQRFRQAGFDDYIAKPITKSQLIKLLSKYRPQSA